MASAQAMVATVGSTAGGTEVSASEKVPRPVQLSRPTKTSAPMPEASSPGSATRLSVTPPMPATSMIRNAPSSGEPSRVLIAAKLPADAMIVRAIGGASFFEQVHGQRGESAADGDQRRLGAEDRAQAQRGQRGEDDAGQLAVDRRTAAGLEAEGRRVAAVARQVADRQRRSAARRAPARAPATRPARRP